MEFSPLLQKELLKLARCTLENELLGKNHNLAELFQPEFKAKRGIFVTLSKNNELRGCIGHIQPTDSVYENVTELVKASAFNDHRFPPLQAYELEDVSIEISVLSIPVEIDGRSTLDKMEKIKPFEDGVIIKLHGKSATFLPQVWESLPNVKDFMSQLCRKAGLNAKTWQKENLSIQIYKVEHFSEE